MKKLLIAIALIGGIKLGVTIHGNAPFCRVDNGGFNAYCYYYSLSSCKMGLGWGQFCVMR